MSQPTITIQHDSLSEIEKCLWEGHRNPGTGQECFLEEMAFELRVEECAGASPWEEQHSRQKEQWRGTWQQPGCLDGEMGSEAAG